MQSIYLDYNATGPVDAEVAAAIQQAWSECWANPSSQHHAGRRAAVRLEDERDKIVELLGGAPGDRLLFTSGATEANNLLLRGLAGEPPGRIVVSSIEHPSVAAAAEYLRRRGFEVRQVRVDSRGVVDVDHFRQLLDPATRLASVMLVNHETGVLQPVAELAEICGARGVPLHTDAVQAIGKLPLGFGQLGVDALSGSGHKMGAPVGIGLLLLRGGLQLQPLFHGGFQQAGWRPGTQSVALAVGLRIAVERATREAESRREQWGRLRDQLERRLLAGDGSLVVHGQAAPRAPHTSNVAFPGLDRQALLMALDLAGVACSSGSACASGSSEPSPVLQAMGLPEALVESSLRFSLGVSTTASEIEQAADRILNVVNELRSLASFRKSPAPSRMEAGKPL